MRTNMTSRARAVRPSSPYSRWLLMWLKCDEAPGALVLADSSGRGNNVSPNYAPVWRPGFVVGGASILACMRPATPYNSGMLLEPTAIAGTGTTAATEPAWNLTPGATTVDNTGPNQITWTARTPTIAFNSYVSPTNTNGVVCGLGGAVCVPRSSYGMFEQVMGWMKTDTWEYTATTLSCTSTNIVDSAAGIPAGLAVGDVVLATGFATKDDQMFGVVGTSTPTTSNIIISGGMLSADTNAGALPITLRRVHLPYSIVVSAWVTPLTASASTYRGYGLLASSPFGSGSIGQFHAAIREDGSKRVQVNTYSPAGAFLSQSSTNSPQNATNVPIHVVWIWDRIANIQCAYIDGVLGPTIAMGKAHRCVMRDVPDATYYGLRQFLLQFFAGSPIAAYRDVQVYAAPGLPNGINSNSNFTSLITRLRAGGGPLTAGELP